MIKEHRKLSALLFTCVLGQQNPVPGPEAGVSQTSEAGHFLEMMNYCVSWCILEFSARVDLSVTTLESRSQ